MGLTLLPRSVTVYPSDQPGAVHPIPVLGSATATARGGQGFSGGAGEGSGEAVRLGFIVQIWEATYLGHPHREVR